MKGEMHDHVKGLVSVDSERHVWKIHSDRSTDHSSLLYFLLGSVPTPALTLALSLPFFISLSFFLPFHSHPFKTTTCYVVPSEYASPNLTLHLGLHYLHFTSDTQAQSLFCALVYTAEANTASGPPPELKMILLIQYHQPQLWQCGNMARLPLAKSDGKPINVPSDSSTEDG